MYGKLGTKTNYYITSADIKETWFEHVSKLTIEGYRYDSKSAATINFKFNIKENNEITTLTRTCRVYKNSATDKMIEINNISELKGDFYFYVTTTETKSHSVKFRKSSSDYDTGGLVKISYNNNIIKDPDDEFLQTHDFLYQLEE